MEVYANNVLRSFFNSIENDKIGHEIVCKLNMTRVVFLYIRKIKGPVSGSYSWNITEEVRHKPPSNTKKHLLINNLMDFVGN